MLSSPQSRSKLQNFGVHLEPSPRGKVLDGCVITPFREGKTEVRKEVPAVSAPGRLQAAVLSRPPGRKLWLGLGTGAAQPSPRYLPQPQ